MLLLAETPLSDVLFRPSSSTVAAAVAAAAAADDVAAAVDVVAVAVCSFHAVYLLLVLTHAAGYNSWSQLKQGVSPVSLYAGEHHEMAHIQYCSF